MRFSSEQLLWSSAIIMLALPIVFLAVGHLA